MNSCLVLLALTFLTAFSSRAQLVADGATTTLNNVTTNFIGTVTIGTNGSFTLLVLTNAAFLTNSGHGVIGRNTGANSNTVRLTGANTRWLMSLDMIVGSNGMGNRLIVSNSARVENNFGVLAVGLTSSNNEAVVTGSGSVWSNRSSLYVGYTGRGNRLMVSNGGRVLNSVGLLGADASSTDNEALVAGNGSVWSNRSDLYVGFVASGNKLLMTNSGWAVNDVGYLGFDPASKSNEVTVTGAGSLWTNAGGVRVGYSGGGNQLFVLNGGTVLSDGVCFVGQNAGSSNNQAVVSGSGALLDSRLGVSVGSSGSANRLVISNGGWVVTHRPSGIGLGTGSNNVAVVTGAGSTWSNEFALAVGNAGSSSQLIVTNGGQVISDYGLIGGASANNLTMVTGTNSSWICPGDLFVGDDGSSNRLVVSNSGWVANDVGYIGFDPASRSNEVTVTGAGSLWTNAGGVRVGYSGGGNRLFVLDGGTVLSDGVCFVGQNAGSSNNQAVVSGSGALLDSRLGVSVGSGGNANQLVISNGGWVVTHRPSGIGLGAGSNNVAVVSGAGSTWSNEFALAVGNAGERSQLTVTNGGKVFSDYGVIGGASANNLATVVGTDSSWTNQGDLIVGDSGGGNRLVVSSGASVHANGTVFLGQQAASSNNSVLIAGGTLRATAANGTGALDIRRGTNQFSAGLIQTDFLRMTNTLGAFEFNGGLLVTGGAIISNNAPFVVGRTGTTPAVWDVRNGPSIDDHLVYGSVIVGSNSSFNQLLVTNGASLFTSGNGQIGMSSAAKSNLVFLSGTFTRWTLQTDFHLGFTGAVNRLVISNGAQLINEIGVLGINSASTNNEAVVTGPGSLWSNLFGLLVGGGGSGNRLIVTNGATVISGGGLTLGGAATSTNNRVIVDGGTLRITNSANLATFDVRRSTNTLRAGLIELDRLLITNTLGEFEFTGGTLITENTTNSNGREFVVGVNNGAGPAILQLAGNGAHFFGSGLRINNSGSLTGNGTILGVVTVQPLGTLAPGASIGRIALTNPPVLQGATQMEISKNGATLTNDQLQVAGTLTYGGSLIVSNLGPTALSAGDRFQLFSASGYTGLFSLLSLPPLSPGLGWTNKLLVDGSIEVISAQSSQPTFSSISVSGTNLIISGTNGTADANYAVLTATNVTTPLSNWVSIITNQFGAGGAFSFTNPVVPGIPQRYFRIRTP